jgi:tetratricopeptide (TPR) repeat protein
MTVDWKDVLDWTEEQVNDLRLTGYGYLRQGLYERAVVFFEALVSLDGTGLYDQQTLGALYLQVGDARRAIQALDKALVQDPTDLPTQLNKAKAHLTLGERDLGLLLARRLTQVKDRRIRNLAEALLLAYS